jgi:hypothetical protein
LNGIYLPTGPVDMVQCSHTVYDELPDRVQNDLLTLVWKLEPHGWME